MFKEINIKDVKENLVDLISNQWALLTAGDKDSLNTMTVSWGSIGELWGRDMATVYIRPHRYTKKFLDSNDYFSVSFYDEDYKKELAFCGSKSGRDIDKVKECGFTTVLDENAPYFSEAKLVIICRKDAVGVFSPEQFVDESIMSEYAAGDFHSIYYGAIEKVLIKE